MKSAVETLSPTRAKLTVEVPFEELKPSLDAAYKKIAQQINVPGFRKGKVPPAVIDRQVGRGAVLDEAINDVAADRSTSRRSQENDLEPLAQPEIEVDQVRGQRDPRVHRRGRRQARDHAARLRRASRPRSRTSRSPTTTSTEQVAGAARAVRAPSSTSSAPAADGDFVVIDLKATQDGEVVEGAEVTGMSYQVGRGGMLDGLDEALVGMSAGEEKTFTSQLVGGDLVGEDVEVAVAVSQVQEQELPELDDEFAQMASEFDTVDELDRRRPRAARPRQAARAGRRRPRRRARGAARAGRDPAARDASSPTSSTPAAQSVEQQLAYAGMTHGRVPRGRGPDRSRSSRPTSSAGSATRSPRSSSSTRSPRTRSSASTRTSSPSTWCAAPSSPARTRRSSSTTCSSTTTCPSWCRRSCAARRWRTIVEAAVVKDASGNVVELKNLRPDGTIGEPDGRAEAADEAEASTDEPAETRLTPSRLTRATAPRVHNCALRR